MLHKFLEPGPWFHAKRYGLGTGLPFKWQGWALLASHVVLLLGVVHQLHNQPRYMVPLLIVLAVAPLPVYAARTEGGWKWRWGKRL